MSAFRIKVRSVINGLFKAFKLEMNWEKITEIYSVDVFLFIVAIV